MHQHVKADKPTLYFIGVTTTQSSIMRVFPEWAKALGLKDAVIKGIDIPIHADPAHYRGVTAFIRDDERSLITHLHELGRNELLGPGEDSEVQQPRRCV